MKKEIKNILEELCRAQVGDLDRTYIIEQLSLEESTLQILKTVQTELEIIKGKIALASYHSGLPVDLSWLDHRIKELEKEIKNEL